MFKSQFKWEVDPGEALQRLNAGLRNKAMRIALNAAAAPVRNAVKSSAPKGEGNLAAATKIKVTNYKNKGVWVAVVGAGSKFKRLKKRKVKGKNGKTVSRTVKNKKGNRVYARPAVYQPLVDKGTKNVRGRNYLPAALRTSQQQFNATFKRKLNEVVNQLLSQKGK